MKKIKFSSIALIVLCIPSIKAQQSIDAYVKEPASNNFVLVANSSNSLSTPVDLDFYPDQNKRPFELWILNQGTNSSGGSTEIVFNANQSNRTYKYVKDGNAWHFMALASAMAFGDSNWATSQDILDANRQGGKYTGPTLWPGNLGIYGIIGNPPTAQYNGSHLDMIHQTPFGKGIAFESANNYWVLDGYDGTLKRYNFSSDHGPGQSDHSDGSIRVYSEFKFKMSTTLPSHIVIDAQRKYLYGCDPVGKRIFRIDITTGTNSGSLTKINNEPLDGGYYKYTGASITDSLITRLSSPVGIDVYGDRLIVTDNGTDEIIIFDISKNYKEVGRIKLQYTPNPDPMGVKVGPDGKIYFVDKANKLAYMIDNSSVKPLKTKNTELENIFSVYPNPIQNELLIQSKEHGNFSVNIFNLLGKKIYSASDIANLQLSTQNWESGIYFVQISQGEKTIIKKIIKQ